jgi:hypothetical protein
MTHTDHTAPSRRLPRVLTTALRPTTLRRETARPTVAFDRQLPRVQRYTMLTIPR